jgi:hypothetical protein
MTKPSSTAVTRFIWICVILGLALGSGTIAISSFVVGQQSAARAQAQAEHVAAIAKAQTAIQKRATASAIAAHLALDTANHDRRLLHAICKAFNRRDAISAWQTMALTKIEQEYPHPNKSANDVAYHAARIAVLSKGAKLASFVAHFDCVHGMISALHESPTATFSP